RPSMSTSSLFASRELKPRMLTAHLLASTRPTCTPGTSRSASGTLVTRARRKSSLVSTKMALGLVCVGSRLREAEYTSTCISSSSESRFSSCGEGMAANAGTAPAAARQSTVQRDLEGSKKCLRCVSPGLVILRPCVASMASLTGLAFAPILAASSSVENSVSTEIPSLRLHRASKSKDSAISTVLDECNDVRELAGRQIRLVYREAQRARVSVTVGVLVESHRQ